MTLLSVNLNKIAVLRNSRGGNEPDIATAANTCIDAGCGGLTVHPRPDMRHVTPGDVRTLAGLLRGRVEYNIEGNPFAPARGAYPGLLELAREVRPDQVTLVTETLSTDPFRYLVLPRLLAGLLTLPALVLVADIIGVFGGYVIAVYKLGFNSSAYVKHTIDFLTTLDVVSGLTKAAVFGFVVALMGCYHGYHSRGGAQGVGAATTYAVVSGSILILLVNYLLTSLLFIS